MGGAYDLSQRDKPAPGDTSRAIVRNHDLNLVAIAMHKLVDDSAAQLEAIKQMQVTLEAQTTHLAELVAAIESANGGRDVS